MRLVVCSAKPADQSEFLEYWSAAYDYPDDHLYTRNIGQPLTDASIRELYRWKNGTPLSAAKQSSVETNFVQRRTELLARRTDENPRDILSDLGEGRPIWRIFWLHCWQPDRFPIFDQHVYRAMTYIECGTAAELSGAANSKIGAYLDEYIGFYRKFPGDRRIVDKALWTFGRAIRHPWFHPE